MGTERSVGVELWDEVGSEMVETGEPVAGWFVMCLGDPRSLPPPIHTSDRFCSDSVARLGRVEDSALARPVWELRERSTVISLEDRTAGRKVSSDDDP